MLFILPLFAESPYSGKARPFGKRAGFIHNSKFSQLARITPSALYGRGDGGQPEPGGRSWSPCVRGSRAPCCADAFWADTYGTWSTLLIQFVLMLTGPAAPKIYRTAITVYPSKNRLSRNSFSKIRPAHPSVPVPGPHAPTAHRYPYGRSGRTPQAGGKSAGAGPGPG